MAESKAVKPKKAAAGRPDFATLGGLVVGLGGIIAGMLLEHGKLQDVSQFTAALIVFGGTLGAVMITTPLPVLLRAARQFGSVFFDSRSYAGRSHRRDHRVCYAGAQAGHRFARTAGRRRSGSVSAQGAQPGGGRHRHEPDPQHHGARNHSHGAGRRDGSQGVRLRRRLFADHWNHRRGAGPDPGHEEPRQHRRGGARHRRGVCGYGLRCGLRPICCFFPPATS